MLQIAFFVSSVVARNVESSHHFLGHQGNHLSRDISEAPLRKKPSDKECDVEGCVSKFTGEKTNCCVHINPGSNEGVRETCVNGARGSLLTRNAIPATNPCYDNRFSHQFTCCPKDTSANESSDDADPAGGNDSAEKSTLLKQIQEEIKRRNPNKSSDHVEQPSGDDSAQKSTLQKQIEEEIQKRKEKKAIKESMR